VPRRSRYRYVDFAARAQAGFRNRVVPVAEVPALVDEYGADECYASIFRFADDVLLYLAENRVDGRPSIAGYDGRVWAPFVPFDIDAHRPRGVLTEALFVARDTYDLLVNRWQIAASAVHPYFSGAKGFHLLVDTRAFGRVPPSRDLHRVFSRVRLEVLRALPDSVRSLFDLAIGDKARLLRLPNTRHASSGLYKIALAPDELMEASVTEIHALARTPRPLPHVTAAGLEPTGEVKEAAVAAETMARARRTLRQGRDSHPYRFSAPPSDPAAALCAARLAMFQSRVEPGNRNNVAIRLASAFRLAGYGDEQTLGLLLGWNRRTRGGLPEEELRRVVQSAYARPYPYSYGCHDDVIRSYCPFVGQWNECEDHRDATPRAGRH
jgi:hypothetical protein